MTRVGSQRHSIYICVCVCVCVCVCMCVCITLNGKLCAKCKITNLYSAKTGFFLFMMLMLQRGLTAQHCYISNIGPTASNSVLVFVCRTIG
jgi:hypothetical protein